jgi:hypothetical protein
VLTGGAGFGTCSAAVVRHVAAWCDRLLEWYDRIASDGFPDLAHNSPPENRQVPKRPTHAKGCTFPRLAFVDVQRWANPVSLDAETEALTD